jgi:hypothetical protein
MEIRNWRIVITERKEWRSTVLETMVHRGMWYLTRRKMRNRRKRRRGRGRNIFVFINIQVSYKFSADFVTP